MAVENFTTYTERDDYEGITVGAATITASGGFPEYPHSYVRADKGASYFGATFTHTFSATVGVCDPLHGICPWTITNAHGGWWDLASDSAQAISILPYRGEGATFGDVKVELQNWEIPDSDATSWDILDAGTRYYYTVERTGETALQVRIYSDSGRTTLLDTLVIDVTSGRRYQYIYAFNSYSDTYEAYDVIAGIVYDLDLAPAAGGTYVPFIGMHQLQGGLSAYTGGLMR